MTQIAVDPDDLEYLGQVLAGVKREMELLGLRIDGFEPALGVERVRRAVGRAISNWSDVREKLVAELGSLSGLLMGAACEYRALEQQIAAAAAQSEDLPGGSLGVAGAG